MERFEDDNPKNLYVIRRKLAALHPGVGGSWFMTIGNFNLRILVPFNEPGREKSCVLDYKKIDANLIEYNKGGGYNFVDLRSDPRFSSYQPILYDTYKSPNSIINMGDGHGMPILQLMELIRYLHRLSNLTAFA